MYLPTRTSDTSRNPSVARPCLTVMPCGSFTTGLGVTTIFAITAGDLGERFGAQVVQMLGAAEHRSERIRPCVSEERRPQRHRWAAWAPKIRRGAPAGIARSTFVPWFWWKQRLADQALIRRQVAFARLRDDFVGEARRLRLLVPAGADKPLTYKLLVV